MSQFNQGKAQAELTVLCTAACAEAIFRSDAGSSKRIEHQNGSQAPILWLGSPHAKRRQGYRAFITQRPGFRGGRPVLAESGISVRAIAIDNNRGLSPDEIAANRPVSLAQVHAALAYYYANKAEIDADIEAEARAYEEGAAAARQETMSTR